MAREPFGAELDLPAARRALDLVSRSPKARAVFLGGYDGVGDGVAALRQYLARVDDPAAGEADRVRMENLARSAFARPSNRAEAQQAEAAVVAYEKVMGDRRRKVAALTRALAALERHGDAEAGGTRGPGGDPPSAAGPRFESSVPSSAESPARWTAESTESSAHSTGEPSARSAVTSSAESSAPASLRRAVDGQTAERTTRNWRVRIAALGAIGIAVAVILASGIASGWMLPGDPGADAQGVTASSAADDDSDPPGDATGAEFDAQAGGETGFDAATGGGDAAGTETADGPDRPDAAPAPRWHIELSSPWGDRPEPVTWFLGQQEQTDVVPAAYDPVLAVSTVAVDRSTTRHVAALAYQDLTLDFWVAKAADSHYCLIATLAEASSGALACVTLDDYRESGIPLTSLPGPRGPVDAVWDGRAVTLEPAMSLQ
jgi:hypothetical protein